MPAFTAVGAYVAGTLLGLAGTAAVIVGAIVATGAAYITSRVINGNANKGGNSSSGSQGGRIQVPPATNNKIPVLYGSAYMNGIITDARLISLEQKINDVMYYCIVLGEYSNNLIVNAGNFIVGQKYTISTVGTTNFTLIGAASNTVGVTFTATGVGTGTGQARYNPVVGLEGVYWNDLRLTPLPGMESHIVKDGRKVVDGAIVNAGSFVTGNTYVITKRGTTDFTLIGAPTNNIGQIFTATGAGTGTGQAQEEDFIDKNFIDGTNQYVELRVYAGGSDKTQQIYPPQAGGNTANAYNFWGSGPPPNGDGDGSWDSTYQMDGLIFAIVRVRYSGDKGFTGLPNMTFQLANNIANPADVWYDYMTSKRYGAGIDPQYIDETARLAWYNFCEEDITYTNVAGETNQSTVRYNMNGVIDTNRPVKTNIDSIMQNGGAWLSYDVATGLWSPVIKKAVSAGEPGQTATYFTASRAATTLTVTTFPNGRIEPGQRLYNSANAFIGTITAQIFPLLAGETTGQRGRYTTSSSGVISSTTFYTLPASTLEFSDDNIISGITLSSTRLDDLYNKVEAEFYNKYNKDQKAYSRTNLPTLERNPNEPDNELRMSLDFVNNSMQADILSQIEMRQSRDDLVIEFSTDHYGIQAQAGDIIAVTSELYDWAPKYFRVMRVKEIEGDDGSLTAQIQALEYNPDVYTIEPITEFSTSANIGIGVWGSSPNLPEPPNVVISTVDTDVAIPNFQLQVGIPSTGGPFDEIELYYTEGWDEHSVTGYIDNNATPGTYSGVAGNILTVTATPFGSINAGDYFPVAGGATAITVVNQLTNNPVSKTWSSGGTNLSPLLTLTNVTGLLVGNTLKGAGIESGAVILEINPVGSPANTVRLDRSISAPNLAGVKIIGTAGQFSCTATTVPIRVNQTIVISGNIGGTGSITGYANPTTYKVSATNGSTTFTLTTVGGSPIVTTAGTPTGLTYVFDQIAQGTYAVFGGIGTYTVDTTVAVAPVTADIYDFPLVTEYKYLKKIVPEGNVPTFTNGTSITAVITEVPANSATYRRWFIKARMGVKKRFGAFSEPGTKDFVGGRFPFQPSPTGGGSLNDLSDVTITTPVLGDFLWYNGTTWINENEPQVNTKDQTLRLTRTSSIAQQSYEDVVALRINDRVTDAPNNLTDDGGAAIQFERSSGVSGTPVAFGQISMEWFGTTNVHKFKVVTSTDEFDPGTSPPYPNSPVLIESTKNETNINQGKLYVDAVNGRVSINNTSPQYELHVFDSGNDNAQIGLTNSERTFLISNNASDDLLSFNYNGVDRLQFDLTNQWFNSGRLGVNNSSPAYNLDVTGDGFISTDLTVGNNIYMRGTDLVLNSDATSGTQDVTITFERGSSGDTYIKYNETTDRFEFASPITTLTNLGARFSEDLFGTGLHGAVVAGTTGSIFTAGNFTFQRNNASYPSTNASIIVDRFGGATDSYITWTESTATWSISNNLLVENNLTVNNDINLVGDIVQQTSVSTKTITTTAFYSEYSNSLFSPGVFQTIDSWDRTVYRSAKYILNIENTTDATRFQVLECLILGTSTPYITVYGDIFNDGSTIVLATELDAINSNLVNLRAYALFPPSISGGITRITGQRTLFAKST